MNTGDLVLLDCKRCKKNWDYKGKSTWYASCPTCRTTVKIPREDKITKKEVVDESGPDWAKKDFESNSIESDKVGENNE